MLTDEDPPQSSAIASSSIGNGNTTSDAALNPVLPSAQAAEIIIGPGLPCAAWTEAVARLRARTVISKSRRSRIRRFYEVLLRARVWESGRLSVGLGTVYNTRQSSMGRELGSVKGTGEVEVALEKERERQREVLEEKTAELESLRQKVKSLESELERERKEKDCWRNKFERLMLQNARKKGDTGSVNTDSASIPATAPPASKTVKPAAAATPPPVAVSNSQASKSTPPTPVPTKKTVSKASKSPPPTPAPTGIFDTVDYILATSPVARRRRVQPPQAVIHPSPTAMTASPPPPAPLLKAPIATIPIPPIPQKSPTTKPAALRQTYAPVVPAPRADILFRVSEINNPPPCLDHYLTPRGCLTPTSCKYIHDLHLTANELLALKYLAQRIRCFKGMECTDQLCYLGHQCQVGPVGACKGREVLCQFEEMEHWPGTLVRAQAGVKNPVQQIGKASSAQAPLVQSGRLGTSAPVKTPPAAKAQVAPSRATSSGKSAALSLTISLPIANPPPTRPTEGSSSKRRGRGARGSESTRNRRERRERAQERLRIEPEGSNPGNVVVGASSPAIDTKPRRPGAKRVTSAREGDGVEDCVADGEVILRSGVAEGDGDLLVWSGDDDGAGLWEEENVEEDLLGGELEYSPTLSLGEDFNLLDW